MFCINRKIPILIYPVTTDRHRDSNVLYQKNDTDINMCFRSANKSTS